MPRRLLLATPVMLAALALVAVGLVARPGTADAQSRGTPSPSPRASSTPTPRPSATAVRTATPTPAPPTPTPTIAPTPTPDPVAGGRAIDQSDWKTRAPIVLACLGLVITVDTVVVTKILRDRRRRGAQKPAPPNGNQPPRP
jgi:hypothetical protein